MNESQNQVYRMIDVHVETDSSLERTVYPDTPLRQLI